MTKDLTPIQQKAYKAILEGKSIFLTGEAGTGKSKVIQTFWNNSTDKQNIGLTSTTGSSALLLGGSTLHSYLGIGLGKGDVDTLVERIASKQYILKRWFNLRVLIIDEVSMLSPDLFDKLNTVAQRLRYGRKSNQFRIQLLSKGKGKIKHWGGIQLVLSGDFCQLPVVPDTSSRLGQYTFEATTWDKSIDNTFYLTQNMRQCGQDQFQRLLSQFRVGKVSPENLKLLNSRVHATWSSDALKPTVLCALNAQVNAINEEELDSIAEKNKDIEFIEYDMKISKLPGVPDWLVRKYEKDCIAPSSIQLTTGVQVMLVKNIYEGDGDQRKLLLGNGSLGIVSKIDEENQFPHVTFTNGTTLLIEPHQFEIRSIPTEHKKNGVVEVVLHQLPLKIAYAISIHKSQGLTLERAEVDLTGCFCTGQAYVALSRVRSLNGLTLTSKCDPQFIQADPKCVEYYQRLTEYRL